MTSEGEEFKDTEIREPISEPQYREYTTNWGRDMSPVEVVDFAPGVDWKTAVFIVAMMITIQAFTLGIVLITWWVIK